MTRSRFSMTPAEKKATDAVVRAAKWWFKNGICVTLSGKPHEVDADLHGAVSRLLREEAKRKGVRRGK